MARQSRLTDEEIKVIRQMLQERLQSPAIRTRVEFDRSDVMVKSIRVSGRMADDAVTKAGVNFNRLVEQLLWEYLGRDPQYTVRMTENE